MKRRIVLLQSYPRSGNTLVRHVLEDVFGVKTYTLYPNEGAVLWADRHATRHTLPTNGTVFIKTHEDGHFADTAHEAYKALYIVRDGRDTLLSHAHFLADYDGMCGKCWRQRLRGLVGGEDGAVDGASSGLHWGNHVAQLMPRADAVVSFEELLRTPIASTRAALAKMGVLLGPVRGTMPAFNTLKKKTPKFYRQGSAGQWKNEFPRDLLDLFWQNHGFAMELAGYGRRLANVCH